MEGSDPASFSRPMRELSANGASQLSDAAQRAMSMTRSSGAAVALLDVNELVTCASCGESVPPVGARSPISGFTALAIRKGQTLVCDDTQADTRVDAAVCRNIKVFSMAVAPIKVGTAIEGAFAIFFNSPQAANRMRVAMLRTLADVAGAILERESAGVEKPTAPTAPAAAPANSAGFAVQPVLVPNPSASAPGLARTAAAAVLKEITDDEIMGAVERFGSEPAGGPRSRMEQKAPVPARAETHQRSEAGPPAKPSRLEHVVQPKAPAALETAVTTPATKRDTKPASPSEPKLVAVATERLATTKSTPDEPQLLPAAADPQAGPVLPLRTPIRAVKQVPVKETPLFQAVGVATPRSRISRRFLLPVAGVAAVVVAVAGFILYRSPGVNAKAATTAPQATREQPLPAAAAPEPAEASVEVDAAPTDTSVQPAEPPKRIERAPAKKQLAESAPPEPVRVVRSATDQAQGHTEQPLVEAPPAIAASAPSSIVLPAPKPGVPAAPAPRASVFQAATLMQMTKPVYPPFAAARRVQGTVVLQIRISKEGKVVQAKPVKGDPALGQAAVNAVRNWRYKPATRDGVPVDSDGEVSVNFKMPGQ